MRAANPQPVVSSGVTPHRRGRWLVTAAAFGLACALAGCDGSPEKRLADSAERVASWSTAAEMAGDSWSARIVPRRYAEAAAQAAQRGIEEERTGLARKPEALAQARVASSVREMSELSVLAARLERRSGAATARGPGRSRTRSARAGARCATRAAGEEGLQRPPRRHHQRRRVHRGRLPVHVGRGGVRVRVPAPVGGRGRHVGPEALLERLAVGFQSFFREPPRKGYAIRRDQMDLSDPEHPRLACSAQELRRLEPEDEQPLPGSAEPRRRSHKGEG